MVESRMGAVAWAFGHRPVSHPRSSNRTSRFPASGFPTGFTARHATGPLGAGVGGTERLVLGELHRMSIRECLALAPCAVARGTCAHVQRRIGRRYGMRGSA